MYTGTSIVALRCRRINATTGCEVGTIEYIPIAASVNHEVPWLWCLSDVQVQRLPETRMPLRKWCLHLQVWRVWHTSVQLVLILLWYLQTPADSDLNWQILQIQEVIQWKCWFCVRGHGGNTGVGESWLGNLRNIQYIPLLCAISNIYHCYHYHIEVDTSVVVATKM